MKKKKVKASVAKVEKPFWQRVTADPGDETRRGRVNEAENVAAAAAATARPEKPTNQLGTSTPAQHFEIRKILRPPKGISKECDQIYRWAEKKFAPSPQNLRYRNVIN